jgi:hypothetical protein
MNKEEIIEDFLQRIPDRASVHDTAEAIEFIAGIQKGLDELDRNQGIQIEDVERELPSWIIK